ncbi:hypothetical protein YC2023_115130 [Brassica napus]
MMLMMTFIVTVTNPQVEMNGLMYQKSNKRTNRHIRNGRLKDREKKMRSRVNNLRYHTNPYHSFSINTSQILFICFKELRKQEKTAAREHLVLVFLALFFNGNANFSFATANL